MQDTVTTQIHYRQVKDINNPTPVQASYLESLGVDVGAYCHNADPDEVLPLSNLIKPLNKKDSK